MISPSASVRNLGVILDAQMTMRQRVVTYQPQARKQKNANIDFLYYVSIFTLSHIQCTNDIYSIMTFLTKYLLPLLSLLIDPKYAVVPSCLFLSLVHMFDDNLQPHNDVVHSVSCTCR